MRYLRSLICAGIAMMAVAICATMPATAAPVTYDPGIYQAIVSPADYPAPSLLVVAVHSEHAAVPADIMMTAVSLDGRSSGDTGLNFASFDLGADFRISPHLRC